MNKPATTPRLVLLLKSGPGTGTSIAHKGGYAKYGNPPRWHKITAEAPAPKGAPVAAHPKSAGTHAAAAHFTDSQWTALRLPDSNVNAPVFNKALEKLKAWSDAGDVTAIVGAGFGSNTYGQRLAKIANTLLGMHGSAHKVEAGQKPGTHAAAQVAEPADPHPTGLPEHLAPKAAEPTPAEDANATGGAAGSAKKDGGSKQAGPVPGSFFTDEVNAAPMLHTTSDTAAAAIKKDGFKLSMNSMYGKGVYFSSVALSEKYGSSVLSAKLKPHKQLVLADDTDAPKAFSLITGMHVAHMGSDAGAKAMLSAGVGSMSFPVDEQTYTVVFDPGLIEVASQDTPTGPLTMPDFQEGKTTTGVQALYQGVGQKVIDHGHAGNVSVLEDMPDPAKKMWHGKTPNSKKLLALHAAAVAHAKGEKPDAGPKLPPGWSGSTGGIATKPGPDGGIVDKNAAGLGWFAIPHDDSKSEALKGKFFDSQQAAIDALAADDTGPKEGDTKPGADGDTLVLKDGRWVKQGAVPQAAPVVASEAAKFNVGHNVVVSPDLQTEHAGMPGKVVEVKNYGSKSKPDYHFVVKLEDGPKEMFQSSELDRAEPAAAAGGGRPAPTDKPATHGALTAQQLQNLQSIPWFKLKLPAENTNAKSHNAAMAKIEAMAFAGDVAGLKAFADGKAGAKQTYVKKQALTAQTALAGLGVDGATAAVPVEPAPEPEPEAAAKPPITADTPLTPTQLKALGGMSVDDMQAVVDAPGLPPNVQSYLKKQLAPSAVSVQSAVFLNTTDGHNKFWSASIHGSTLKTEYGKIGAKGQTTVKDFGTPGAAVAAYKKLIDEKKAKGYAYQGQGVHLHDAPAAAVEQGSLAQKLAAASSASDKLKVQKEFLATNGKSASTFQQLSEAFEKDGDSASAQYWANKAAEERGPKDGDTKPGADGMLVFKNGHWVKVEQAAPAAPAAKALKPGEAIKVMAGVPAAPAKGMKEKFKAMAVAGDVAGLQSWIDNESAGKPASKQVAKALIAAMTGGVGANPAPSAAPAAPAASAPTPGGPQSMDSWAQTGKQGGSNPGGKFKDPTGQEWYCKFPADADTAKSEILAAKLYALAGLSSQDAVLVTKGGKVGIASRWVDIKKASSPGALAQVDGSLSGFAVDAWLGNWDVVGLGYDNLQVGPDGKAHRVDAGGSLEYRAQGEKKPFGSKVDELDTLLDEKKNPQAASVFKGMTTADLTASAAKVLAISDVAIRAMVNQYGPGDAAAKAKLAETLIARKADLAKRFPAAVKKKKAPVFKPEDISAPPSFLNWGGKGSSGPSSKEFLNQANEEAVQAIFAAAKTGDLDVIKGLKAKVYDKDTGQVTGEKPVLEHPSQHVKGYAQQAVNEINYQLYPPKKFRFDGGHPMHSLNAAYPAHNGPPSSAAAQKLGKFIVLGEPGVVKLEELGLPEKIKHAEGGGTLSSQTYAKQAQAAIAKMPATQKQAVKSYTGGSYHAMNGSLWGGNPSGAAKAAGEALKTLGHDIAPGTVLSRQLSLHGQNLQDILGSVGKILQEPAIMSTSIRPSSWVRNVQFKLHVGPGVKGLWVGHHSLLGGGALSINSGEDEMILPPGTRLLVTSVRKGGKDADGFGANGQAHVIEAIILPTE
jgi:predicted DNA-binding WGR domain protein